MSDQGWTLDANSSGSTTSLPAHRTPRQLRAARGWSLAQTARVFHLTTTTIAFWMKRLDEEGPKALLQTHSPVNRFPDFVRALVQRVHLLCPRLGKVKTAQILARAGLHLASCTVGRMRREPPAPPRLSSPQTMPSARRVTARYPDHVWHVDLTTVPTSAGFWTSWSPLALPQCWPFCWWLAVIMDHFSRRVHGLALFAQPPTAKQVRDILGRFVSRLGKAPRHLITDQGKQFSAEVFTGWCRRRGIRQRFGAVGKQGSIAVVERMIRTVKHECTRALPVVSLRRRSLQRELQFFLNWYHADRPHTALKGATPDEIYYGTRPACRQPRFEPRSGWPRASPCAQPRVLVKGQPGAKLELRVEFRSGRRHLPSMIVTRAA
jgi:putative transposase